MSLFSNCGAGDLGYRTAGFRFDVLAELDEARLGVALNNHPGAVGVPGDLRESLPQAIAAWRRKQGAGTPALLAACPPCQGMSSARSGRGFEADPVAGSRDPRNLLVETIVDAAEELEPRVLVVENVPAFLTRQVHHPRTGKSISAAAWLIQSLSDDYFVWPVLVNFADFGVPQMRKRSYLTLIRKNEQAAHTLIARALSPYPEPSHQGRWVHLEDALAEMQLPPLDAATNDLAADAALPLHEVPVWSAERYSMIASVPPNSGATAWQNSKCPSCDRQETNESSTKCGRCGTLLHRPIIEVDGEFRLIRGFRRSSYARMRPDEPAATITTASGRIGSDRTIHPFENRVLSPLECQLLQTFPRDFRWGNASDTAGITAVRAMIGEAVPPMFTRAHGRILRSLLEGRVPQRGMRRDDPRSRSAIRTLERVLAAASETGPSHVGLAPEESSLRYI